ncbi:hypothetical protein PspLS_01109 [Pyricularia sp. CBS 133598]|nr:hypothetical protein PspLS_01109 [Pyricularia sp. CBS 133598]
MISREARRFFVLYVPLITAIFLSIRLIRKHTTSQHPRQKLLWAHPTSPKWGSRPNFKDAAVAKHMGTDDGDDGSKIFAAGAGAGAGAAIPQQNGDKPPSPPDPPRMVTSQTAPEKLGVLLSTDPFQGASQAVPETHVVVSSSGALNLGSKTPLGGARNNPFTPLVFGGRTAINPNVLPHPTRPDAYVMVAQEHPPPPDSFGRFTELTCDAAVNGRGELACVTFPVALAIEPTNTKGNACDDPEKPALELLQINQGPHDARVFFGPRGENPLVSYGSNSGFTCFGQWVQDFRVVSRWGEQLDGGQAVVAPVDKTLTLADQLFARGTEMQRPFGHRYSPVEKNFFLFWDRDGVMHAHHDMHPTRVLGRLNADGSVGRDLGPDTAAADGACLAHYLPVLERVSFLSGPGDEDDSVHQSTNSLSVTMCKRADAGCKPGPGNTFIATVVQHKRYRGFRSSYEAYMVLFRQEAPFALHAVSRRPLWISGRRRAVVPASVDGGGAAVERTEMFYITSLNWMRRGQGYHGYLDDVILAGFGIEDERPAVLDVRAEDLFQDLGLC